jgi:DNA-binding MarR family transcriptional regulator
MNEITQSRDLAFRLLEAAQAIEAKIEGALEPLGLSLAKLNVLSTLIESSNPLSLGDLATRLNCVRSNVTQLVDRLEAGGLVRREADPGDRRSIRARITDAGRERQYAGSIALSDVQESVAKRLAEFDPQVLARALSAVASLR